MFGPVEPPNDYRIFNRRRADGTFPPLSEFFEQAVRKADEAVEHTLAHGQACTCPLSDTGSILYYSQDCKVHALPPS